MALNRFQKKAAQSRKLHEARDLIGEIESILSREVPSNAEKLDDIESAVARYRKGKSDA